MRLFIAIQFTEEMKKVLTTCIAQLRGQSWYGNFTRPENLHLTLAFIGETNRVEPLKAIMDSIAPAPFRLCLDKAGQFGDLWWIGIRKNRTRFDYVSRLRTTLAENDFPVDNRYFRPHITIGRHITVNRDIILPVPKTTMWVHRISLMKSERIQSRLVYTEIYGRTL